MSTNENTPSVSTPASMSSSTSAVDRRHPVAVGVSSQLHCPAKVFFLERNSCMKSLVVMCRGLMGTDGMPLLEPTAAPWKFFKPSSTMKAKATDYRDEIERRYNVFITENPRDLLPLPRPKAWKLDQIFKWLDENQIKSPADVMFLTKTVNNKKLLFTEAFDASKAEKELLERS